MPKASRVRAVMMARATKIFHAYAGLQASMNDFLKMLKTARYAEFPPE